MGGNTNAGVKWPIAGDLPESPLSAALIKARTSLGAAFFGGLTYLDSATGLPNDDQVFGESVDLAPGTNVFVYAAGMRNPYDMVLTTSGRIYMTDNVPNSGFGPASTGPTSIDPVQPQYGDELLLIRHGLYYGSPNRNRGRYFPAENVYQNPNVPDVPGEFRQTLTTYPSSTDGIAEYRARTFQGQIRGNLFVQKYAGQLRRIALSADGLSVVSNIVMDPFTSGLGVETGPGGALLVGYHDGDSLKVLVPDDASALGLIAQDITPWRAPSSGGHRFVIGGVGFGTLSDTTVSFGDIPAELTSVSPTRIVGTVPANPAADKELLDVTVTVGALSDTITDAFRYLCAPGCELGTWEPLPALPYALNEVSAAAINGKLYVVGDGDPRTAVFDLETKQWIADGPARPFPGRAHGAEVVGGKLYLIGGLGAGSAGKVQIYDPVAKTWSTGAAMPWAGGAVSTALIQGKIYAAGGVVGAATVRNTAAYDPVGNSWTALALMPVGRNQTAAASDGRRMYVFGGRDGGVGLTNGFNDVQVYDPKTNTWKWDKDGVSGLPPLPQARGGMGKAVFFQGELFVFGGETSSGPGALPSKVYDRVDVYDPVENTWRLDTPMLDPRHGAFPIHYEGKIYLPAGGSAAGGPPSTLFDAFTRL
jgi:N-acetylneuraminic acid mutarotase